MKVKLYHCSSSRVDVIIEFINSDGRVMREKYFPECTKTNVHIYIYTNIHTYVYTNVM